MKLFTDLEKPTQAPACPAKHFKLNPTNMHKVIRKKHSIASESGNISALACHLLAQKNVRN